MGKGFKRQPSPLRAQHPREFWGEGGGYPNIHGSKGTPQSTGRFEACLIRYLLLRNTLSVPFAAVVSW